MDTTQVRQSTRGLWVDTRDGTVYNATLREAITRSGGTIVDYHRCWRALRKQARWPADVAIRPATIADIDAAKRTMTWEVEVVLCSKADVGATEDWVLANGGWLRRVSIDELVLRRKVVRYRCIWLVSGLTGVEFLRHIVEPRGGRIQEVDEGQYQTVIRSWRRSAH